MGVGKKKISSSRQRPRASADDDSAGDAGPRVPALIRKITPHRDNFISSLDTATCTLPLVGVSSSAVTPTTVTSVPAVSRSRGSKSSNPYATYGNAGETSTSPVHIDDEATKNIYLQQLLLKQAAPRLGPQPTLLCYPSYLCASQGVASMLLPPTAADNVSFKTAAASSASFDYHSDAALCALPACFPVRHSQQLEAAAEKTEQRRVSEHIDAASRLAASLPHALYEVLSPVYSSKQRVLKQSQPQHAVQGHQFLTKVPPIQQGEQHKQNRQGIVDATLSTTLSFQQFQTAFIDAADMTLQRMRRCDCCGSRVESLQSARAIRREENHRLLPQGAVKVAESSFLDGRRPRQKKGYEGEAAAAAAKTQQLTPAAPISALCVIPVLEPSSRCILITPPKRVCMRCLQILHLPQLLALSVASILSPQTSPHAKVAFSEALSHFARVNGFPLTDGDDSQPLTSYQISQQRNAGGCLQQAIAAAFCLAALRRAAVCACVVIHKHITSSTLYVILGLAFIYLRLFPGVCAGV